MTCCSIEGCPIDARTRGWCVMHYQRWRRHGDVNHERRGRTACAIEGCDTFRVRGGFCSMHYERQQKYGTPDGPSCWDCSRVPNRCDTHRPTVCVCDVPVTGPVMGQCARCYRPYWVRSPELQATMPAVREAWRRFLADEGVYRLYVATGVDA